MFAIALWDAPRERLVLARDRLGKKPLLWTRLPDGTLAFASETKALLRLPGVPREVDLARSTRTSRSSTSPARTGFAAIEKVPPGHVLVVENGARARRALLAAEPAAPDERGRVARARARAR